MPVGAAMAGGERVSGNMPCRPTTPAGALVTDVESVIVVLPESVAQAVEPVAYLVV